MTVEEIRQLVAIMQAGKVQALKSGDLEIAMHPLAFMDSQPALKEALGADAGRPTEEEYLFMSSPLGPPEINATPPVEP